MKIFLIILLSLLLGINIYSQEVSFTVSSNDSLKSISPYIYGTNQLLGGGENWSSHRLGGNRLTGYNWENNASNAGKDYFHYSDNYLVQAEGIPDDSSNVPGIVTTTFHNQSLQLGAYSLITLQMAGYVSKDKNGAVTEAETAPSPRWDKVKFQKGSPFNLKPDISDTNVYMDEFINFLVNKYGKADSSIGIKGYALDNEPTLWSENHPRIHPVKTTCTEIIARTIALAGAVKDVDPYAEIFGPALYGFNAYTTFQNAVDWNTVRSGKSYSWFIDYYLDKMKEAENTAGKRLLDVLDIHWYPEAMGDKRITDNDANSNADKLARVQAPRTLWDKNYKEKSWITQSGTKLLPLIPNLTKSINKYYPGTKLGFTELSYGGENDITGAIAVDDVLGIFGKYGIYFGAFWKVNTSSNYVSAAYKMYRNYDGNNSTFGNYYIPSQTSDSVNCSIYGSINKEENEIHLIVINKNFNENITGNFKISSPKDIISGRVWKLDKNSTVINEISHIDSIRNNSFSYLLPAESICHFVLKTSNIAGVSQKERIPEKFYVNAYPNPFNPECKIEYNIPDNSVSRIDIISVNGELIKSYVQLTHHGILYWDGTNQNNQKVASGFYCAILRNGYRLTTRKLLLLK